MFRRRDSSPSNGPAAASPLSDPFARPTAAEAGAVVGRLVTLPNAPSQGAALAAISALLDASGVPDDLAKRQRWFVDNPRLLEIPWRWVDRASETAESAGDVVTTLRAFAFAHYFALVLRPQMSTTADLLELGLGDIPPEAWVAVRDRARRAATSLAPEDVVVGDESGSWDVATVAGWAEAAGDRPGT